MDYLFFPLRSEAINFLVKATNDVNVALTTGPADCNPMYEVVTEFSLLLGRPLFNKHEFTKCPDILIVLQ